MSGDIFDPSKYDSVIIGPAHQSAMLYCQSGHTWSANGRREINCPECRLEGYPAEVFAALGASESEAKADFNKWYDKK